MHGLWNEIKKEHSCQKSAQGTFPRGGRTGLPYRGKSGGRYVYYRKLCYRYLLSLIRICQLCDYFSIFRDINILMCGKHEIFSKVLFELCRCDRHIISRKIPRRRMSRRMTALLPAGSRSADSSLCFKFFQELNDWRLTRQASPLHFYKGGKAGG